MARLRKTDTRRLRRRAMLATWILVLAGPSFTMAAAADESIEFKAVDFAILRIDQRPAKTWDVYLAEKHKLMLVRLGSRHLLLDLAAREVFEIAPEAFEQRKQTLALKKSVWEGIQDDDKAQPGVEQRAKQKPLRQRLPSEEWNIRNAGPARIYRVKLSEEGRVIEVQLRIVPTYLRD